MKLCDALLPWDNWTWSISSNKDIYIRLKCEGRQSLRFESPWSHEFCDKHNALLASERRLPRIIEADNVGMLKPLQHLGLLLKALLLRLGQFAVLQWKGTQEVNDQKKRF